ncbi:MAG: isoprenylcysteine carboxylmethyltransferase family protein [Anaerolineales bacterium]
MAEKTLTPRLLIQLIVFILIVPLLPLLITWRWAWWEAWVYAAINILGFVISRALVARRHPDLLGERARTMDHKDAEKWDKLLAPLSGLGGGLIPLVAGLDVRFGWSASFGFPVKIVSLVIFLVGYILASSALVANPFFSGVVRIQADRDHRVVTGGPYRWIRHPGYAGALFTYLATPFFLDALWTFVPVVLIVVVVVIRTRLEDNSLEDKLAGYPDYQNKVPYRLFPGIW